MKREPHVAYFCMEYGLSEAFPIYSGGLGVLAGDFIKSARDLGSPLVACGLRWEHGYSVQTIGPDGQPRDEFRSYESAFLSDTGVRVQYLGPRSTLTPFNDARVKAYLGATGAALDPPERVADALLKLLESERSERYVGYPECLAVLVYGLACSWLEGAFLKHRRNLP